MKKRYTKILIFLLMISLVSTLVLAKPDNSLSRHRMPVIMPKDAIEVAPGVFSLGSRLYEGKIVEGYVILAHREDFEKSSARNNAFGFNSKSPCYGFLATGAKWKTIEPYIVNPDNDRNLDPVFIRSNIASDINKWEDAANGIMNDGRGINIFGNEGSGGVDGADMQAPDNKNEVYFAKIDQPGVIAITVIWGIFSGPINQRQLIEWDQVYNDVDFDWSTIGEAGKMDFENIATHELGHSAGLNDLYNTKCSEQTMYGYANYGETKKRTLESGDITGINLLY